MTKNKCSVCGNSYPVASVAQLHCQDQKEWFDDEENDETWLRVDDDWERIHI